MLSFCEKGMTRKRIRKSAPKLFKNEELCYSIEEANRILSGHHSRSAPTRSNGRDMSANESFNFRWRYITKKELSAHMYSDREVCFISILRAGFLNDYGRGNQLGEVIHDESGKDFLVYVLHLFCVKMK